MTSSDEAFPVGGPEPEQRVWALLRAKRVLDMRPPFGKGEISPIDLVNLSKYILTGEDFYVVTPDEQVTA